MGLVAPADPDHLQDCVGIWRSALNLQGKCLIYSQQGVFSVRYQPWQKRAGIIHAGTQTWIAITPNSMICSTAPAEYLQAFHSTCATDNRVAHHQ